MNPISNNNNIYINDWKQLDQKDAKGRDQVSGDLLINGKTYTVTLGYSKNLADKLRNSDDVIKFLKKVVEDESKSLSNLVRENPSGFEIDISTKDIEEKPQDNETLPEMDSTPVAKKAVHVASASTPKEEEAIKGDDKSADTLSKTTAAFQKSVTERFKKWLSQRPKNEEEVLDLGIKTKVKQKEAEPPADQELLLQ